MKYSSHKLDSDLRTLAFWENVERDFETDENLNAHLTDPTTENGTLASPSMESSAVRECMTEPG
jgi:hypothetical protein